MAPAMNEARFLLVGLALVCACGGDPPAVATHHDAPTVDAGTDVPDAGPVGPPVRTVTTRPLYGTDVHSLLVDPFVTSDLSWGHFRAFETSSSDSTYVPFVRTWMSDSPVGTAAPVVRLQPFAAKSTSSLSALVPGTAAAIDAQIWVSLSASDGTPIAFDGHEADVHVTMLSNKGLPTSTDEKTYKFAHAPVETQTLHDRTWSRLALASPVPYAQGGFFLIEVSDPTVTWLFAAPQVTVSTSTSHRAVRGERATERQLQIARAHLQNVREHAH